MLWVDKYTPKSLSDLDYNEECTTLLQNISKSNDLPHIILYGPSGVGKATRVRLLLREVYGDGVKLVKMDTVQIEGKLDFRVAGSTYHTELFVSDLGSRDRLCVQVLIKQLAGLTSAATFTGSRAKCRVFIIFEAHRLSIQAQASLRRTMEQCASASRIILVTERMSSIIAPLRSRCLCVRVSAPSPSVIRKVLTRIAELEKLTVENLVMDEIITRSGGDLRLAILTLQNFVMCNQTKFPVWKEGVQKIVKNIVNKPSVSALLESRTELFNMFVACIDSQLILEALTTALLENQAVEFKKKAQIAAAAAFYSDAISQGSKEIFHLEAFVANAMLTLSR